MGRTHVEAGASGAVSGRRDDLDVAQVYFAPLEQDGRTAESGEFLQFANMPAEFRIETLRHDVQTVAQFVAMAEILAGHASERSHTLDFIDMTRVVEQNIAIISQ